jgi:hypothetical protein
VTVWVQVQLENGTPIGATTSLLLSRHSASRWLLTSGSDESRVNGRSRSCWDNPGGVRLTEEVLGEACRGAKVNPNIGHRRSADAGMVVGGGERLA